MRSMVCIECVILIVRIVDVGITLTFLDEAIKTARNRLGHLVGHVTEEETDVQPMTKVETDKP